MSFLWLHTGAILAGGRSSRMGAPKEGLRLPNGRAMVEHVLATMLAFCRQVVILGESRGFAVPRDKRIIHLLDKRPGLGPLAGLESLLSSGLDTEYVVAACDQPLITVPLLKKLVADDPARPHFFRSAQSSLIYPLPGYFPAEMLAGVQTALDSDDRSLFRLIKQSDAIFVPVSPEDESLLRSVNTPEDLKEIEQQMGFGRV